MKNKFSVSDDGQIAIIELKRRNGDIIHCLVDSADLPKLQEHNVQWLAQWSPRGRRFYVVCREKANGEYRTIYMHRFLMDAPAHLQVDHKYHDSLDNRRGKLRVVTPRANSMNRRGAASHSQTGHRGIWPYLGKFQLQLTIDGRKRHIGFFDTVESAIAARDQLPEYVNTHVV